MTREQMDALVDGHFRAEETRDIQAIVAGFASRVRARRRWASRRGDPRPRADRLDFAGLREQLCE